MHHISLTFLGAASSLGHTLLMVTAEGREDMPKHKAHSKPLLLWCLLSHTAKTEVKGDHTLNITQFSSVQSFGHVWFFTTPWTTACQASLSITNSQVYSSSHPSSWWCHPTISSSVSPFSSCLQFFPALRSFQMSQLFASGGQSIGVSALASVLPMNIQDWSPLGWTGWISLQSKGLSRVFSNTIVQKHQFFGPQLSL